MATHAPQCLIHHAPDGEYVSERDCDCGARIAELEAAVRRGLTALSRLRTAIDDEAGMAELERLMIDTAATQAELETITQ